MGINQFTIFTEKEYIERFLSHNIMELTQPAPVKAKIPIKTAGMVIDWTTSGAVGPVRNQGTCGSGILYGTLGAV